MTRGVMLPGALTVTERLPVVSPPPPPPGPVVDGLPLEHARAPTAARTRIVTRIQPRTDATRCTQPVTLSAYSRVSEGRMDSHRQPAYRSEVSETNHHLAGALVLLAGLLLIGSQRAQQRWTWLRLVWPACFLACGLFLLVYSDLDLWPFGDRSWWYGLSHDSEDLQHKTFALILLALGSVELQRARGRLSSRWAIWAFPVLALIGAAMLPLHQHATDMSGMHNMGAMQRIQSEHTAFAITGSAIAVLKGLSELRTRWQLVFLKSWPVGLIVLGVQLLSYVET